MKDDNRNQDYSIIQMFDSVIKRVRELRIIADFITGKAVVTKEDAYRKEIAVQMFSLMNKDSQMNIIRQMGYLLIEQYNLKNV